MPRLELRGARVLVVDDNENAATVLSEMLSGLEFEVRTVHSGAAAIEAVRDAQAVGQSYRIVLLDWQMPGLGRACRRHAACRRWPCLRRRAT